MRTLLRGTRALIGALVFAAAVVPSVSVAQPTVLGFEEVPTNSAGVNNGFSGLLGWSFFNWSVATTSSLGSGTNASAGTKFALGQDTFSSFFRTSGERFNVLSAWLSFRQFDVTSPDNTPIGITVNGYRTGDLTPTFTRVIMLTNTAQQFTFNWFDLDEFSFETENLVSPTRTVALALDDLAVVVPEPDAAVLVGTGLLLLLVVRRVRRAA
jgi:hypothetical protein